MQFNVSLNVLSKRLLEPLQLHTNKSGFLPLSGSYKITGRDSLVFLVDASKEMFIKGEDGQPSNFDMTMQVRWSMMFFWNYLRYNVQAGKRCF